jgi:hypothetical protein
MTALDTLIIIAMVIVGALTHTHSSRLIPKVSKSMLKGMGTMWALIKSKQVEEVFEVAAIRHMETITLHIFDVDL